MCTNITTINPQSLLTPAELAALEAAQETITNPPTFPPSAVPDWERQLLEPEFVARIEAEAAASWSAADTVEQARHTVEGITALVEERRELIARLREDVDHVDLDHVQDTLMPGVTVSRAGGPIQWVETLLAVTGQEESGPLRRLLAGVQSATSRRDNHVEWDLRPYSRGHAYPVWRLEETFLQVTAKSTHGAFSNRRWEISSRFLVEEDSYGELKITPAKKAEHRLTVWSARGDDHTVYTGRVVAEMAERWMRSYLAREGIRDALVPDRSPQYDEVEKVLSDITHFSHWALVQDDPEGEMTLSVGYHLEDQEWRETAAAIVEALTAAGYVLTPVDEGMTVMDALTSLRTIEITANEPVRRRRLDTAAYLAALEVVADAAGQGQRSDVEADPDDLIAGLSLVAATALNQLAQQTGRNVIDLLNELRTQADAVL